MEIAKINPSQDRLRLRWRYDYLDHKPPVVGIWSYSSNNPNEQAWNKSKENLAYATIEGKTMNSQPVTLVRCAGLDFCFFQWESIGKANPFFKGKSNVIHFLYGLSMITRDEKILVRDDGKIFRIPRTQEDMNYNYAAFGK